MHRHPLTSTIIGGGKVRFNPNLYNCGKVCLSLLGTWSGSKDEQWSYASSMLQVLVSIQSLILIPKPYFNEPGYESSMHSADGKKRSDSYNENIQLVRDELVDEGCSLSHRADVHALRNGGHYAQAT